MFIKKLFLFFVVIFSINSHADMNKCIDVKGNVTYSDKPCDTNSKSESVQTNKTNPLDKKVETSKKDEKLTYQCDGRIYCSQMTSCEEAKFFLKNCPGVKMDGAPPGSNIKNEPDGIPCEDQWCGH